ncbi:MAG: glycosyltransferase [Clostridiales Family XIII bacterium]|jgi:glycosyltransferase involved in cell wall biosynthesis|nr:glycosyltransferase [Clostridiales Family XIII bacterium]
MSDDKYLISIIIPIYNAGDYLSGAFDSILNQTIGFERLEVIFADDSSSDGSAGRIDDLAAKYENVVALHAEGNSGYAGRQRNRGVERATAPYLMFLDQDDAYYPDACKLLYEAASESGSDIASGCYSEYGPDGHCIAEIAGAYRNATAFHISTVDDYPEVLKLHSGFWAKIYRRRLIEDHHIRFIEDSPVEDMVFFGEAVLCMSGYKYIERPIVRYLVRNKGDDRSLSFKATEESTRAVGRGYDELYRVFAGYGKEGYLKYIMFEKGEYYTTILLRWEYPGIDAAIGCVKGLHSIYEGIARYSDETQTYAPATMTALVGEKRYEEAARFLLAAQHFSRRIDALREENAALGRSFSDKLDKARSKNQELKEKNRALSERLRLAEKSYGELQRRLKHSIIIRILNKIRGWRLF